VSQRIMTNPTTISLTVDPGQSPAEEAELRARVAAAVAEDTGDADIDVHLIHTEHVTIHGAVADRMQGAARWSA
jgi:hypothetical protein